MGKILSTVGTLCLEIGGAILIPNQPKYGLTLVLLGLLFGGLSLYLWHRDSRKNPSESSLEPKSRKEPSITSDYHFKKREFEDDFNDFAGMADAGLDATYIQLRNLYQQGLTIKDKYSDYLEYMFRHEDNPLPDGQAQKWADSVYNLLQTKLPKEAFKFSHLGYAIVERRTQFEDYLMKLKEIIEKYPGIPGPQDKKEIVNLCDAVDYVIDILIPDRIPNHTNHDTETKPVMKLFTERFRNGDLRSWGRYVDENADREFDRNEWKYRELHPLKANIPYQNKAQTVNVGSHDEHPLTAIRVDMNEVRRLWPKS